MWPCLVDTQTSAQRITGTRGPRRVWPGLMTEGACGWWGLQSQDGDKAEASRTPLGTHTGLASSWLSSPEDSHRGPVPALLWLSHELRVLGFCGLRAEPVSEHGPTPAEQPRVSHPPFSMPSALRGRVL